MVHILKWICNPYKFYSNNWMYNHKCSNILSFFLTCLVIEQVTWMNEYPTKVDENSQTPVALLTLYDCWTFFVARPYWARLPFSSTAQSRRGLRDGWASFPFSLAKRSMWLEWVPWRRRPTQNTQTWHHFRRIQIS